LDGENAAAVEEEEEEANRRHTPRLLHDEP
jgi:hypothetical protein